MVYHLTFTMQNPAFFLGENNWSKKLDVFIVYYYWLFSEGHPGCGISVGPVLA